MSLYKRGRIYWYNFEFQGKRYQGTTRLRNERQASQFEAKVRSDLALGLVGLTTLKPGPAFEKYAKQFREFVRTRNADHPRTVEFYEEKLDRLLEYKPLADCRLKAIDEKLIEEYVRNRRKKVGPATVNRELATLRRALRLASSTFKLIDRVPHIGLLLGEVGREFVLSYQQEKAYLAAAADTLRDFAILSLDTGVRAGEGVSLEWEDVCFDAAHGARLGYIHIRKGKSRNAKRILSMTPRVRSMLENRRRFFPEAHFVFPGKKQGTHMRVSSLDHQHVDARAAAVVETENGKEKLPQSFVIHSLRHTFGTRFGMCPDADAFTIMKVMGHSTVTVSQKYVHPTPDRMERAFEQLESMNQILRGDQEAERKLGVVTKVTTPRKRSS